MADLENDQDIEESREWAPPRAGFWDFCIEHPFITFMIFAAGCEAVVDLVKALRGIH